MLALPIEMILLIFNSIINITKITNSHLIEKPPPGCLIITNILRYTISHFIFVLSLVIEIGKLH